MQDILDETIARFERSERSDVIFKMAIDDLKTLQECLKITREHLSSISVIEQIYIFHEKLESYALGAKDTYDCIRRRYDEYLIEKPQNDGTFIQTFEEFVTQFLETNIRDLIQKDVVHDPLICIREALSVLNGESFDEIYQTLKMKYTKRVQVFEKIRFVIRSKEKLRSSRLDFKFPEEFVRRMVYSHEMEHYPQTPCREISRALWKEALFGHVHHNKGGSSDFWYTIPLIVAGKVLEVPFEAESGNEQKFTNMFGSCNIYRLYYSYTPSDPQKREKLKMLLRIVTE